MSGDLYYIVACKECDNVWIVDGRPERTSCTLCNERYKFEKLKKLFKTPDKEKAKQARGLKQAELNGVEHIYEGLLKQGVFDRDVMDAVSDEEYLKEKGVDVEALGGDESSDLGGRSDKELVMEAIREVDSPDDEDVAEFVGEYGVSREDAFELVDRLCLNGEAMRKRGGGLRLV